MSVTIPSTVTFCKARMVSTIPDPTGFPLIWVVTMLCLGMANFMLGSPSSVNLRVLTALAVALFFPVRRISPIVGAGWSASEAKRKSKTLSVNFLFCCAYTALTVVKSAMAPPSSLLIANSPAVFRPGSSKPAKEQVAVTKSGNLLKLSQLEMSPCRNTRSCAHPLDPPCPR